MDHYSGNVDTVGMLIFTMFSDRRVNFFLFNMNTILSGVYRIEIVLVDSESELDELVSVSDFTHLGIGDVVKYSMT